MGRKLNEVIASLPTEQQLRIEVLAQQKIEETLAHARTLTDFRKAVGKTQAEVATVLGIKQHAVSQLEQRSDTYVSTLRKFLESLGMKLELAVVTDRGVKIELPNFRPWAEEPSMPPAPEARAVTPKRAANSRINKAPTKANTEKKTVAVAKRG